MSNIRIKSWNLPGFTEIRSSPEVRNLVEHHAQRMASQAGPGYGWNSQQGNRRVMGLVGTNTFAARLDHYRNNTLLKVMGS